LLSPNILVGVESEIEIEFENPDEANIVLGSIKPEISGSPSDRTSVNIDTYQSTLRITIEAQDNASFRASLNSYLRWIKLSSEILSLRKEDSQSMH
jgi:KEOPS complex subunit Pcc1